ncbi:protein takeout-like isoform X1 [Rhodnius prolixus]|uniref:Putative odorant binding protein n=3 Tax=Rhodnius TaxID=13248 RepID=R4G7S5_RHOPR
MYCTLVFLLSLVGLSLAVKLPAYVKTCSRNDPKLSECALRHGREMIPKIIPGDPSIRLPRLEPLLLERVEIHPSGNGGSINMRLVCYKCQVAGLSRASLNDIKLDLNKKHIDIRLSIPRLMVTGKYDVSGKVLVFPITGKGISNITLTDLDVNAGLDWKLIKRKRHEYSQFIRHKVTFTASGLKINLSNLFNGDKLLSDNMNMILNANWREVLQDLKPSISDTVGQIIRITLNQIFDIIPYSQFFPDS